MAVAGLVLGVFGLLTVGVVVVALYPDPPERPADIQEAVEPLPGPGVAPTASERGYQRSGSGCGLAAGQ